ncbi:MAG TPA: hypothetical protein VJU82_13980 [Acidobacteriaceae bacterium]|nr:hypothetical protein [Acidobacteriaceae bacterium]
MKYLGLSLSCFLLAFQPCLASEVVLPAGTIVNIKLADKIDSARDASGKQYTASVAAPVVIAGNQTIPAGSRATVVLVHNNSGWMTQLKALTVNGRQLEVSSGAGTLATAKPAPSSSIVQQMGLSHAGGIVSDERLLLPPNTELRFRVIESATRGQLVASVPRSRHSARANPSPEVAPAVPEKEAGIAYLCSAKDKSDRPLPTSYYVADVFETSDKPDVVERRWRQHLIATYPYTFANNPHAIVRCTRLADLAAEREARQRLDAQSKSENAQIIETRWHYTLGPPPHPAASTGATATPPVAATAAPHPQTR